LAFSLQILEANRISNDPASYVASIIGMDIGEEGSSRREMFNRRFGLPTEAERGFQKQLGFPFPKSVPASFFGGKQPAAPKWEDLTPEEKKAAIDFGLLI